MCVYTVCMLCNNQGHRVVYRLLMGKLCLHTAPHQPHRWALWWPAATVSCMWPNTGNSASTFSMFPQPQIMKERAKPQWVGFNPDRHKADDQISLQHLSLSRTGYLRSRQWQEATSSGLTCCQGLETSETTRRPDGSHCSAVTRKEDLPLGTD